MDSATVSLGRTILYSRIANTKNTGVNRMMNAAARYGATGLADRCCMSRYAQYALTSQIRTM